MQGDNICSSILGESVVLMHKYNQNSCKCRPAAIAIACWSHEAADYSKQFYEMGTWIMRLTTDRLLHFNMIATIHLNKNISSFASCNPKRNSPCLCTFTFSKLSKLPSEINYMKILPNATKFKQSSPFRPVALLGISSMYTWTHNLQVEPASPRMEGLHRCRRW